MTENNYVELWNRCLGIIRDNVPETTYNTWFLPIKPVKYDGKELTVEVPTQFYYEFIEEKFIGLLRSALDRVFGEDSRLMYSFPMVKDKADERVDIPSQKLPATSRKQPKDLRKGPAIYDAPYPQDLDSCLKASYTFESFIEGESNRLPRVMAENIAEHPGKTPFNPLFLYSPSGLGKTHLVNAIGNRIKELYPEKRVLYVSAHLFQVQYTDSVRNNTLNDFINFYRTIDVLIIDDVQEFAGLTKTQNTFFHIFNYLHQKGNQLVLTSDRSPVALQGIEERMLTRFKWGLLAELERPNLELRKNILKSKMHRDGLKFPESVVDYIAENVNQSVRELESIVNALMAYSVVNNRDIDLDLAERVVNKVVKIEKKPLTVESILAKVCAHYDVNPESVQSRSRKREVLQVRQVAMYLAKKYTEATFSQIGLTIGRKDHATVLHSCKTIKNQLDVDKELRSELEEIETELRAV